MFVLISLNTDIDGNDILIKNFIIIDIQLKEPNKNAHNSNF